MKVATRVFRILALLTTVGSAIMCFAFAVAALRHGKHVNLVTILAALYFTGAALFTFLPIRKIFPSRKAITIFLCVASLPAAFIVLRILFCIVVMFIMLAKETNGVVLCPTGSPLRGEMPLVIIFLTMDVFFLFLCSMFPIWLLCERKQYMSDITKKDAGQLTEASPAFDHPAEEK